MVLKITVFGSMVKNKSKPLKISMVNVLVWTLDSTLVFIPILTPNTLTEKSIILSFLTKPLMINNQNTSTPYKTVPQILKPKKEVKNKHLPLNKPLTPDIVSMFVPQALILVNLVPLPHLKLLLNNKVLVKKFQLLKTLNQELLAKKVLKVKRLKKNFPIIKQKQLATKIVTNLQLEITELNKLNLSKKMTALLLVLKLELIQSEFLEKSLSLNVPLNVTKTLVMSLEQGNILMNP